MHKSSKKDAYKPRVNEHLLTINEVAYVYPREPETAEDILCSLIEDVKLAFGTDNVDEIDEEGMDWPDLAITYHQAVEFLKTHVN